jgi:hypothetical protein
MFQYKESSRKMLEVQPKLQQLCASHQVQWRPQLCANHEVHLCLFLLLHTQTALCHKSVSGVSLRSGGILMWLEVFHDSSNYCSIWEYLGPISTCGGAGLAKGGHKKTKSSFMHHLMKQTNFATSVVS